MPAREYCHLLDGGVSKISLNTLHIVCGYVATLADFTLCVAFSSGLHQTETAKDDGGVASINLSEEAVASIVGLDDHPVEDTDADRADRMLAALAGIPEAERLGMGLDIEAMRAIPLEERLARLEELWTMRQQELREAYDALPKVNELLTARIEVMQDEGASEAALELALTDLEDLLSDIDMARDFHSIGGFPTLASMLHVSRPEVVREVAAWAIGTAVKNENAHQLWVLEVSARAACVFWLARKRWTIRSCVFRCRDRYEFVN